MHDHRSLSCDKYRLPSSPLTIILDVINIPKKVQSSLNQQLHFSLDKIKYQHASYVKCIRKCLKNKKVTPEQLCADLLYLPGLSPHSEKKLSLLSDLREQLKQAATIDAIFIVLSDIYSFHDCFVFQTIVEDYGLDEGQEALKYPEYLKAYMESHKVSELIHC